jgi:hypothetical protein
MSVGELFAPGFRYWREQREFQKVRINQALAPGPGDDHVDESTGTVFIRDRSVPSTGSGPSSDDRISTESISSQTDHPAQTG